MTPIPTAPSVGLRRRDMVGAGRPLAEGPVDSHKVVSPGLSQSLTKSYPIPCPGGSPRVRSEVFFVARDSFYPPHPPCPPLPLALTGGGEGGREGFLGRRLRRRPKNPISIPPPRAAVDSLFPCAAIPPPPTVPDTRDESSRPPGGSAPPVVPASSPHRDDTGRATWYGSGTPPLGLHPSTPHPARRSCR